MKEDRLAFLLDKEIRKRLFNLLKPVTAKELAETLKKMPAKEIIEQRVKDDFMRELEKLKAVTDENKTRTDI